jgi:hypothetical protein
MNQQLSVAQSALGLASGASESAIAGRRFLAIQSKGVTSSSKYTRCRKVGALSSIAASEGTA